MEHHVIQQLPWPEFSYKPQVSFSIAHTGNCILLKYFVKEKTIRIVHYADNSPVHEDSCVEFFIAFDKGEEYYNLEFNCEGTCLFGFGINTLQRKLVDADVIRTIRRQSAIKSNMSGEEHSISWELALIIPVEVFVYHKISSLKNMHCKVNFYKCGDKLPEPHFLSWQDLKASAPDFHLPEFFGDAFFE
jgi:cellulose/xylan binding protein with CBM9 domain